MEQGYCIVLPEKQNAHRVKYVQDVDLLRYCQQAVKGHIEIVHPRYLYHPYVMLVNDTGLLQNMESNPVASYLYGTQDHRSPIVGPAVILKEVVTDDGPDLCFIDQDETLRLVIELGKAHQWCSMYDFVFDIAMHWTVEDED